MEYDRSQSDVLRSYVVTPNAQRSLTRISRALADGKGGAWTITGPFGTGKSAFCLFCSHAFHASDHRARNVAKAALDGTEAGRKILAEWRNSVPPRLLPVLASGTREPIATTILRALSAALETSSVRVSKILEKRLRAATRNLKQDRNSSQEVVEIVDMLAAEIARSRSKAAGVLLVLDELGKSLEYAAGHGGEGDIFLLQQLAECAVRSEGRIAVVGVLHQDFRAYASGLPPADRAEWEKIRGRFEDIVFEEPADQLLRFVSIAWSTICQESHIVCGDAVTRAIRSSATRLWEHGLVPAGLQLREDGDLLTAAAPMHPLVAVLIGPVFRRFGQNERSAFSFMLSEEPTAIRAFCRSTSSTRKLFDVVDLYVYLRASLGPTLLHTADAKRWAEAFDAESKHPGLSEHATDVLRAIALLGIASRWYPVRATHEVLAYSLGDRLDSQSIDIALGELQAAGVIIHRRYNDSFVIWEGSDVDVADRIAEGRSRLGPTTAAAGLLRRHYHVRPVLARRHSFQTGTLRFFEVTFQDWNGIDHEADNTPLAYDGRIVVALGSPQDGLQTTDFGARTIVRIPPPGHRLDEYALELAAIDWARQNTPELNNDSAARRELHTRRLEIERLVDVAIDRVLRADVSHGTWMLAGKPLIVSHGRSLNERLSSICDEVFHAAPQIDSELVNRRELSSAAAKARGVLVEQMVVASDQESLGLVGGDPPERSMYRAVLSSEGLKLHRATPDGWAFRPPPRNTTGVKVCKAVIEFLKETESEPASLNQLFERLTSPPFGLRSGVIPLIVFAVLLSRKDEVAIYESGAFQPEWQPAMFDRMIKSPQAFAIRRWQVTGLRSDLFDRISRLLRLDGVPATPSGKILAVVRPLLQFISSLPEHARVTKRVSSTALAVREALLSAEEPDDLLFVQLPKACGLRPFGAKVAGRSQDADQFVKTLRDALDELRSALPTLVEEARSALVEAFSLPDDSAATDVLRGRAIAISDYAVDRDLKLLVDRIRADGDADEATRAIATFIGERPIDRWKDEDHARYLVRLNQFARRFTMLEATTAGRIGSNADTCESVRVSVVSSTRGHIDQIVHLNKRSENRARALEAKVLAQIENSTDRAATIAALSRVLYSFQTVDETAES